MIETEYDSEEISDGVNALDIFVEMLDDGTISDQQILCGVRAMIGLDPGALYGDKKAQKEALIDPEILKKNAAKQREWLSKRDWSM